MKALITLENVPCLICPYPGYRTHNYHNFQILLLLFEKKSLMESRHCRLSYFKAVTTSRINLEKMVSPTCLLRPLRWEDSLGQAQPQLVFVHLKQLPCPCLPLRAQREKLRCAVASMIRLAGNSPWIGGWKAFGIMPSHLC